MTRLKEKRFGFMPRRSTTKPIFLLTRLQEIYYKKKEDLQMVFIEQEKSYK